MSSVEADTGWSPPPPPPPWRGCHLDREGCLSLDQILRSFSAPISEEHAWAVIHQALQCLSKLLDELARVEMVAVTNTRHILINTEGKVHRNTFLAVKEPRPASSRQRASSENKTVAELGVVIFTALDFGLKEDEERQLSPALENVIDLMTSADEDDEESGGESGVTDDEGIEDDHDEGETSIENGDNDKTELHHRAAVQSIGKSGTCDTLIALCRHHLALPSEADAHFRAVCRALVTEAVELSSFMEKVSGTTSRLETDSELGQLDIQDWARLWVQVIHELRSGVRLKKTEYTRTPIEFELTPYEILMDDIRSKRYKLNKVMVEGRLPPKVKRDAHDVILEFIRSRPPLKPASDRKLAAMRKQSTPVELLMESIRSEQSRNSLRKTSGPPPRPLVLTSVQMESSRCRLGDWQTDSPLLGKKMIKPDPALMSSLLNFSDEETDSGDDHDHQDAGEQRLRSETGPSPSVESGDRKSSWRKQLALDTILHGPRLASQRRHSVSVCQTPTASQPPPLPPQPRAQKMISVTSRDSEDSLEDDDSPASSLCSASPRRSLTSGLSSPEAELDLGGYSLNTPAMHANLHTEFIHSDHWLSALQTLELSLDEVVHIRSVLSRAELDALPLDNNLKDDVERGKVCFLCMKTKFGLFSRGTKCQMCSQLVCRKCFAKMRIPLDHFSSVPVFALSPQSPASPEPETSPSLASAIRDKMSSLTPDLSMFYSTSSTGSAPSSPVSKRKMASVTSRPASAGPGAMMTSLPMATSAQMSRPESASSRGQAPVTRRDSLLGTELCVCTDCKEMVLQVIRAQKTARRLQMTQSLFLNLEQNYTKEEIH